MALERLGCRPPEAAMVGDSLVTDITGGRAAGMFTVWLDNASEGSELGQADLTVRSLVELREVWQSLRL
jgi:FMN phosphatase YigB (HAD superfamily)